MLSDIDVILPNLWLGNLRSSNDIKITNSKNLNIQNLIIL